MALLWRWNLVVCALATVVCSADHGEPSDWTALPMASFFVRESDSSNADAPRHKERVIFLQQSDAMMSMDNKAFNVRRTIHHTSARSLELEDKFAKMHGSSTLLSKSLAHRQLEPSHPKAAAAPAEQSRLERFVNRLHFAQMQTRLQEQPDTEASEMQAEAKTLTPSPRETGNAAPHAPTSEPPPSEEQLRARVEAITAEGEPPKHKKLEDQLLEAQAAAAATQVPQAEQPQEVKQLEVLPSGDQQHDRVQLQNKASGEAEVPPDARKTLAATFTFAFLVKCLCIVSNIVFQVAPLPQVQKFSTDGDTGEVDSAPLIGILFTGFQWSFYGGFAYVVTNEGGFLTIVCSNIIGAVLGIYYMWGFAQNCQDEVSQRKFWVYVKLMVAATLVQAAVIVRLPGPEALFFIGLMSTTASCLGALSMCSTLPKVIETKNSASINVELLFIGLGSSILWCICAVMLWDKWIAIPNFFSLAIQILLTFFVFYYPPVDTPGIAMRRSSSVYANLGQSDSGGSSLHVRFQDDVHDDERVIVEALNQASSSSTDIPGLGGRAATAAAMVIAAMKAAEARSGRLKRSLAMPDEKSSDGDTGGTGCSF
jgi:uncharacterized protein with PQ loop repeat